ncbi:Os12g0235300, partial [Oryza sativa Japonica Group]
SLIHVMDSKSKWILWQESSHKLLGRCLLE